MIASLPGVLPLNVQPIIVVAPIVICLVSMGLLARERARLMRAQADLSRARDVAESAMRARSAFLATMSHEMRTPLNGILGLASLLRDSPLAEADAQYVRHIIDSGNHLLLLVNDVLDWSRLDAGGIVLEVTAFDLRGVVRDAMAPLVPLAEAKQVAFDCTVADDVPRRVGGDPRRLRQVLINIVGNAVKFTREGSVKVTVTRAGELAGGDVRIAFSVQDTGIGIDPAEHERLFAEFSQVDSSIARRFGGSGLGLAISRRLVQQMAGTIRFDSTPGRGTTFFFDVVLRARRASDQDAESAAANPPSYRPSRILLAEDNDTNRLVATRLLERMGHTVRAVTDGQAAVDAVAEGEVDLVLMDVMMPVMDGMAATQAIRRLPDGRGRTPIVGLTAASSHADEAACRAAGMDLFAVKPISAERLAAAIAQLLPGDVPVREHRSFDPARLDAKVREVGAETAADLVRDFLASAPAVIADMRRAADEQRVPSLAAEARLLAVRARAVGLLRVSQAAGEMASAADIPPAAIDRLAAMLAPGLDDLRAWRAPDAA